MKIDLGANFSIDIPEPTLKMITQAFSKCRGNSSGSSFKLLLIDLQVLHGA